LTPYFILHPIGSKLLITSALITGNFKCKRKKVPFPTESLFFLL
jgi:hypothetical protein